MKIEIFAPSVLQYQDVKEQDSPILFSKIPQIKFWENDNIKKLYFYFLIYKNKKKLQNLFNYLDYGFYIIIEKDNSGHINIHEANQKIIKLSEEEEKIIKQIYNYVYMLNEREILEDQEMVQNIASFLKYVITNYPISYKNDQRSLAYFPIISVYIPHPFLMLDKKSQMLLLDKMNASDFLEWLFYGKNSYLVDNIEGISFSLTNELPLFYEILLFSPSMLQTYYSSFSFLENREITKDDSFILLNERIINFLQEYSSNEFFHYLDRLSTIQKNALLLSFLLWMNDNDEFLYKNFISFLIEDEEILNEHNKTFIENVYENISILFKYILQNMSKEELINNIIKAKIIKTMDGKKIFNDKHEKTLSIFVSYLLYRAVQMGIISPSEIINLHKNIEEYTSSYGLLTDGGIATFEIGETENIKEFFKKLFLIHERVTYNNTEIEL